MRTFTSAAAYAPRTPRHPATCSVIASKCGSPSTVYTLVSPDPPVCKTEIHAYDMPLGSSSHCCDAGAGSCTGNGAGAAGSAPVTTAFEAVLYPLAPAVDVADAGAVAVYFPGIVSGTACGYAAAAAAWEPGPESGHQRLSPPCTAGFGYSPIACDLACLPKNTHCYTTDSSALLSPQPSWHSGLRRVRQQHCPAAWSPQQPPI